MPHIKILDQAQLAIQRGESSRAITLLLETTHDTDVHNELLLLSSRFANIKLDKRKGIISYDEATEVLNKANLALISIIDGLKESSGYDKDQEIGNHDLSDVNVLRSSVPDIIYYGFVVMGMLLAIALFVVFGFGYNDWYSKEVSDLSGLLYTSTYAWVGMSFLVGAIDGLNRRSGKMVNWLLIGPFLGMGVCSTIASALLKVAW